MPIIFHDSSKTFHIYNETISYIFKILKNDHLGQLYYGKKVSDKDNYDYLLELDKRAMAVCSYEDDMTFSMEHIKQEYPVYGNGDMHSPSIEIERMDGISLLDFKFDTYEILSGKPDLHPLPHIYANNDDDFTTLVITLKDTVSNISIEMSYSISTHLPVICRNVKVINNSKDPIYLRKVMSLNLDLPDCNYDLVELTGAWSRERYIHTRKLDHGITAIQSLRGHSSNNFNPFMCLKRPNTDENNGEAIGCSFIYSGNFLGSVEVDTYNMTRLMMGIHPQNFKWKLNPSDTFISPEAVLVYSNNGLNEMSQIFHSLFTNNLLRGEWKNKPSPILINNWEATYFDFNEEKILNIAKKAKEIGIELFVLDDGWFGKRNDDTTSLGDWFTDTNKLPLGVSHLSQEVENLGLKFGLWIEPEMVNVESKLYKEHPEWRIETPGYSVSQGRHQYVLDFSNKDVVDYIYSMLEKVISESKISYIKWDMNRSLSEVYSRNLPADRQGEVFHRHIMGVYDLYDRLTTKFPHILFESCSSGGARFDPGMLYYAPQAWTSDDSDAIERLKIQYGTSLVYPIRSMGAHVSASPNHQLKRVTTIQTRGNVACFGTFGYELDLTKLSDEDLEVAKQQIIHMKKYRELLQYGTFYRLVSPFESNVTCWMVVSKDKKEAIVGWYRVLSQINEAYNRIQLQGLDSNFEYEIEEKGMTFNGDELMNIGLITSDHTSGETTNPDSSQNGDFVSRLFHLKAK